VPTCLAAADVVAERGISVEVIDLRSLVPLDMATVLESVGGTGRAVVVHEATTFAGPGAEIASQITEHLFGELMAPVLRVGAQFTPTPFSPALTNRPTLERIVDAVVAVARPA
jgi:pyruvate/2-oxoglutarate/acetoin dehydrogenase E1 component